MTTAPCSVIKMPRGPGSPDGGFICRSAPAGPSSTFLSCKCKNDSDRGSLSI